MNLTRFALPVVLASLFAGAGTASAAPMWLQAQAISGPNSSHTAPDVAVNARGDAAAAWTHKGTASVDATTRSAGGNWRPAAKLTGLSVIGAPRVALDGSGHATAVFAAVTGNSQPIFAAVSSASSWSGAVELSPGSSGVNPVIAVNDRGDAVAVWTGLDIGDVVMRASVRPAGGAWSKPKDLSVAAGGITTAADVAVAPDGRAVATWSVGGAIEAAFYIPASGWAKTNTIVPSTQLQSAEFPRVAIDAGGNATVVWELLGIGLPFPVIETAEGSPSAGWTQPADLQADASSTQPDVAAAPGGGMVATWVRKKGGHAVIEAAQRSGPGAAWGNRVVVSDPGNDSATPSPAIDPQGDAVVAWDQKAAVGHLTYASSRPAGASEWGAQHALAGPASGESTPRVALDSGGDAVAAFVRGTAIDAASMDAAPSLSGVQVPGSGAPGEALAFSAAGADLWSPATIEWDFGDGATATGSPASHAFASPGDYTVKVTARDAAGNETSETHVVHVTAPVSPPLPPAKDFPGLLLKSQRVVVRHGVGRVTAACSAGTAGACAGKLRLLSGKKVVASARFDVRAGRSARIRVRLRRVPRTLRASAIAHDAFGATRTTSAKLKLLRRK